MTINLVDIKKYYKGLAHQTKAIIFLGDILLKTPAKKRLSLHSNTDWVKLADNKLEWLQRQISPHTLSKLAAIWRLDHTRSIEEHAVLFSQRDNPIKPLVSCNSSAHAMFVDYVYRNKLGKSGLKTDDDYVRRVYSGKYGSYGSNNSVSWDVQINVVRSYGIKARYSNKGKKALIHELVKNDLVCPANFRHKGSMYNSYGGHVVLIVEYHPSKGFLIYDPFGERMPSYKNKAKGIYWMSNKEFDLRWQGLFTQYLGPVK